MQQNAERNAKMQQILSSLSLYQFSLSTVYLRWRSYLSLDVLLLLAGGCGVSSLPLPFFHTGCDSRKLGPSTCTRSLISVGESTFFFNNNFWSCNGSSASKDRICETITVTITRHTTYHQQDNPSFACTLWSSSNRKRFEGILQVHVKGTDDEIAVPKDAQHQASRTAWNLLCCSDTFCRYLLTYYRVTTISNMVDGATTTNLKLLTLLRRS
jgi:hypothetical protein